MDNMSFFYSSELSVTVAHSQLAKGTRVRLLKEHLGGFYRPTMADTDNFGEVFTAFRDLASRNSASLRANGTLVGRPVSMAPDNYHFLLNRVYYPNKVSKFLSKTVGWDTEDMWIKLRSRLFSAKPDNTSNVDRSRRTFASSSSSNNNRSSSSPITTSDVPADSHASGESVGHHPPLKAQL